MCIILNNTEVYWIDRIGQFIVSPPKKCIHVCMYAYSCAHPGRPRETQRERCHWHWFLVNNVRWEDFFPQPVTKFFFSWLQHNNTGTEMPAHIIITVICFNPRLLHGPNPGTNRINSDPKSNKKTGPRNLLCKDVWKRRNSTTLKGVKKCSGLSQPKLDYHSQSDSKWRKQQTD